MIHENLSKETDEASGSFWSEGSARWITMSFRTTEGAEGRVEDLKRTATLAHGAAPWNSPPCLGRRKRTD
jgi:hypothetical protein